MRDDLLAPRGDLKQIQEAYRALVPDASERRAVEAAWIAEHFEALTHAVVSASAAPGAQACDFDSCEALICVAGPSIWPTVLFPAWARPKAMLLLRLERSPEATPLHISLPAAVAQVTGLSLDTIEQQWIDGQDEQAIYDEVQDFLARGGFEPAQVLIEASGAGLAGQAAAARVAEAAGACLAVVTGGRSAGGAPGDERVRLVAGPARSAGEDVLDRVREAYAGGRYADAERQAEAASKRLFAPPEAEVLGRLAAAFGAWHRFDFAAAAPPLDALLDLTAQARAQAGWAWAADLDEKVRRSRDALASLCAVPATPQTLAQGRPAILNHLVAARRALAQVDLDDALLLLHGTVERWVDLLLRCEFGVVADTSGVVSLPDAVTTARFHALGEVFFPSYTPLPPQGPLLYLRAVQLLGALAPDRVTFADTGWLRGLGHMRNDLAHKLVPVHPAGKLLRPKFKAVEVWLARQLPDLDFETELARFAFPELGGSRRPGSGL